MRKDPSASYPAPWLWGNFPVKREAWEGSCQLEGAIACVKRASLAERRPHCFEIGPHVRTVRTKLEPRRSSMVGDRVLELTATRERRAAAEVSVAVVRMRAHGVTKALDGLPVRPLSHERNLARAQRTRRAATPAALRPHRDDEHLLAEETMQGRAAQVEAHEDRPARKRRLGAVGKEPGAHGLGLEAAERERLQHRGMAERQVMIEEVPVYLEGVPDVRLEDEEPAPR